MSGQLDWIANYIWGIADDVLRDLYVRGKYRDVILPMTVLRRLDAVLEDTKQQVLDMNARLDDLGVGDKDGPLREAAKHAFYNTSPFTMRDLRARSDRQQLRADFEAYLDGFSPNVADIIDNFEFRNQIDRLSKADALGSLIEKLTSPDINLSPHPVAGADGSELHPGLDNHAMGTIFEELVRRFNEENNEEAGEHWTPRDAVTLMARLVFEPVADQIESSTYLIYDGACGTGGMLTLADETLQEIAAERGKQVSAHLFGQEINAETYAICKADMLLKGEAADNFVGGPEHSTLSNDAFPDKEFDFMLSNPPYGKSWKTDLQRMGGKTGMRDPRFVIDHAGDPAYSLVTRSSDGQMLFLASMVSKMKHATSLGSRIAEVHNGSSLFTGDAGQGESNIRRWIIENDWLEAVIALPLSMFYNTGIATFIWVITNRKPEHRLGKVQLIDTTGWFRPLRKNLGKKTCELSEDDIRRVCDTFLAFEETEQSKIFPNEAFGYWKATVDRPLRLAVDLSSEQRALLRSACVDVNEAALADLIDDLAQRLGPGPHLDYNGFVDMVAEAATEPRLRLTAKRLKLLRASLGVVSDAAEPVVRSYRGTGVEPDPLHGLFGATADGRRSVVEYEHDPHLRDTEQVPLLEEGGVAAFLRREVLPYDAGTWYDPATVKVGYEINFNRHFHKPEPMRSLEEIRADLAALEQETVSFLDVTGFNRDPEEGTRWRVYVDTSVFGASQSDEDDAFREPSQELFRDILVGKLTLVLSDVTQRELDQAPEAVQAVLGRLPFPQTEYADSSGEAETLAKRYISEGALTMGSWADALHIVDVLRNGLRHGPHQVDLFHGTPSPGNAAAVERYRANRFTVIRQLRYSRDGSQRVLDLALFVNGLPVATFELKNSLTKQTVADAVQQYRRDRDPREPLFGLGRCLAHFAVDDQEVRFCTHLRGKASWFLPFNQGWNDGTGNPPNPDGIKTDYLWHHVLARDSLTNIIENYAQKTTSRNDSADRSAREQIWPRFHQLEVVRQLLAHARERGAGQRYLIQHSAGSGKSNSIAWLSHQLVGLRRGQVPVFDSVIVVTDRRVLDQQISDTIKQFAQVSATVGHADRSRDLRKMIEGGKKIIISTVQKFPEILDKISNVHADRTFAIIIDEAHSSQGGRTSAAMSRALSGDSGEPESGDEADEETFEDKINRLIETRRLLPNASYFAFTATPKNKTLEMFGEPVPQPDGAVRHVPFHSYTMKQAIQEGFIVDVLAHYTPVPSYYRLTKTVEGDPRFDTRKAHRKLRRYVESHDHAVRLKAEIMVDHFHEQVVGQRKIGGIARAMVVTDGVERALQYFQAISAYLAERKSPHRALVAFSGEREHGGATVSEASLNGFPSAQIAGRFQQEPYRFLICADKFQTGYDEPLLHTMYVDKILSGIKAVQTLSRLNRAHPGKHDAFVLDFTNDADTIRDAFEPYYRSTVLADETDPDKLHDIVADLSGHQIYAPSQVDDFVAAFLDGVPRDQLDPILDECVAAYLSELAEDQQVDFKGNAKAFLRTYGFLAAILPYGHPEWEKLSIFLNFLVPKLPAPREDDLSRGVLEAVDMDSYRAEKQQAMQIALADEDGEIDPVPTGGGGHLDEPAMDLLSNIIASFNQLFGNIEWEDDDRVQRLITEEIPQKVDADAAYRNAREHSDEQNARIEHDRALRAVMTAILSDDAQLFRLYSDNESFKRWLTDTIFDLTYQNPGSPAEQ